MDKNSNRGYLRAFTPTSAFVWGVWLAMSGYLFWFVYTMGSILPYWDEWELIPYLCGQKPVTLEWLWRQHNEHRILVPKLAYLSMLHLSNGDGRICMYFQAVLMSTIAFVMLVLVRRLRGRLLFADAFFPMIFLHLGHYANVLFAFQIAFTIPAFLICMTLCTLAFESGLPRLGSIIIIGTCSVLLPVCVGSGLMVAPFVGTILVWIAYQYWRSLLPERRRYAALSAGFALATFTLIALYILTYVPPAYHPPSPSRRATLIAAGYFLANSMGVTGAEFWPLSIAFVLAMIAASVLLMLLAIYRKRNDLAKTIRPVSLLLLIGGILALALAIGRGRAGMGIMQGSGPRHSVFAAPVLCIAYICFVLYTRPRGARLVQIILFAVVGASLYSNCAIGLDNGKSQLAAAETFLSELRRGVPLDTAVQAHYQDIYPDPNELHARIMMLSQKQYGAFSNLDIRTK